MSRDAFWAARDKKDEMNRADAAGEVADSMAVRKALMARFHAGEITLAEAQAQLKKIQNGAAAAGKVTRAQAYERG